MLTKSSYIKNVDSWNWLNLGKNTSAGMENWWAPLCCRSLSSFPFGLNFSNIWGYRGTSRKFLKYPIEWHFYISRERNNTLLSTFLLFWAHTGYPFTQEWELLKLFLCLYFIPSAWFVLKLKQICFKRVHTNDLSILIFVC